jgi:uncharacterized protein DUF6221
VADDWMTDAHKAAALEGFRANPVAVTYARQQAEEERMANSAAAIVPWLREQIAETRQIAEAAHEVAAGPWGTPPLLGRDNKAVRQHRGLNDPRAVLAQCEAHTALLDLLERELHDDADDDTAQLMVRTLASAYQHRSGFREEWRVQ